MFHTQRIRSWVAGITLLATSIAHGADPQPDPTDANAPVPAAEYRPVWPRYRADQSPSVEDWKQANQAVSKVKSGAQPQGATPPSAHQHTPERSEPSRHDHATTHQEHCPMMGKAAAHCDHPDQKRAMNCEGGHHDHH